MSAERNIPFLLLVGVLSTCFILSLANYDDCPPITQGQGSPIYPQATVGGSTTMYRVFHTEGDVGELSTAWTRIPSPLDHSTSNFSNTTVVSNSSLNASLTLWDLKLLPDYGNYNVRVCSNCTCANTTFILYLFECVPEHLPIPILNYTKAVIAETALEATQLLYVVFVGETNSFYYYTTWSHGSGEICNEGDLNKSHHFNCNRTVHGNCSFTANLYIHNPTYQDSGNFIVEAVETVGQGSSSQATYELDIVREPSIFCTQDSVTPGGNVDCTIHNYSVSIDLVVVKSDLIEFVKYPASQKCTPKVFDQAMAKCSIKLKDKGSFSICVNYSSSVTTRHILNECSDHIQVDTIFSRYKLWILVPIAVLLLISVAVLVGCCCYCCYKKKKKTSRNRRDNNKHAHHNLDTQVDKDSPKKRKKTSRNRRNSERAPLLYPPLDAEVDKDSPCPMSSTRPHPTPTIQTSTSATRPISSHVSPTKREPEPSTASSITSPNRNVLLVYTKNPGPYEQIKPPAHMTASQEKEYHREVEANEAKRDKRIENHVAMVVRLAEFLTSLGIVVAYEKQLDDQHVPSKHKWLEEKMEESDFIVLVITPSLKQLLNQNDVPQNETFFKGESLSNMINGSAKKPDGSHIKFVCVFLNAPIRLEHIPSGLASANSYALYEPFALQDDDDERRDDIKAFTSLVTKD